MVSGVVQSLGPHSALVHLGGGHLASLSYGQVSKISVDRIALNDIIGKGMAIKVRCAIAGHAWRLLAFG